MPKASASGSSRPALRRNQACLQCRRRKLKCDAARPHCGTCFKAWQAIISVPPPQGYVHPTEPRCQYDPVDGLQLAPEVDTAERIKELEGTIAKLKRQLSESGLQEPLDYVSRSISPSHSSPRNPHLRPGSALSQPSTSGRITPDIRSLASSSSITLPHLPSNIVSSLSIGSPETSFRSDSGSPELRTMRSRGNSAASTLTELIYSGWNPDLPEPHLLNHYIDLFFKCDPCCSRILHRPSFLASMHLHPRDPDFPHSSVLHAICASASRWSSQGVKLLPDGTRRDTFAEYHAGKTRQYIDRTMATGQDIFAVMQACQLLSWYFYQEGRWVEVWIFAGFQMRVAIPLKLNHPGTYSQHGNSSPGAYLAPPKDRRDLESRRRTWWLTILFDRVASVGGWVHAVDEQDIGTEFPLRRADFESDHLEQDNPQSLITKDVYITHPSQFTDSFLLLLKAIMLFGRVTDYNVRGNLRSPYPPSKTQDPFQLKGFKELDSLVCVDFLNSLPHNYRNVFGAEGNTVDTDLYMVHIIPHAAAITLHNPYLDFANENWISTRRCTHAAQQILRSYCDLSSTSMDRTRLHPFATICWYLAAVVQIQLCKHYIELGKTAAEEIVWGEINLLRYAMLEYGQRSPIGTRQERLLQGLMSEIVRLTTQQRPLEVPHVPLYPFSREGLWGTGDSSSAPSVSGSGSEGEEVEYAEGRLGAPLPPNVAFRRGGVGALSDIQSDGAAMGSSPSLGGLPNAIDFRSSILNDRSQGPLGNGPEHRMAWSNGEGIPRISSRNAAFL